jgi:hypothetical protein
MDFFSKQVKRRVIDPLEPIPVGEVEESDWATWADTMGFQDSTPMDFQTTDKLPLTLAESDSIDVFASVGRKGK